MHYHLIGICGTAMASLAGMLQARGHKVTGSDQNVYPPMSTQLEALGIEIFNGYQAANADVGADCVVVGNAISRGNPELEEVLNRKLVYRSQAEIVQEEFIRGRRSLVVAGTHGKTTTTSIATWIAEMGGLDPSFLVGGVVQNFGASFRVTGSVYFVLEDDEYDTAYFDKGPKFLHYRARTAILTSVEFDHADIYRDMPHYESAYEKFAATLPDDGFLAVAASYPNAVRIAQKSSRAYVATYAAHGEADYTAEELAFGPDGAHFVVREPRGRTGRFLLPMSGHHNVENALGVYAAARALGLKADDVRAGFASFAGVKRRQEIRGTVGDILVIDDFAHHPTAVRETIVAIRQRYPDRRLWAVFEPRSNTSRRNIHQSEYASAFDGAALASIRVPEPHDKVPIDEQLDIGKVVDALHAKGIDADASRDVDVIVRRIVSDARPGDVILVMSNGSFGGLIPSVLDGLRAKQAA